MRSRLQQQYQAEMANKYTRDMIPFNQWLAQRNAPKMAGGGARRTLPKERADQNLAKFLEPSAVKNRLYHGTTAKEKSGQALQTLSGDDAPYRGGIETFVSTKPKFASRYAEDEGGYVLPVYAQIKNPFDYRDKHAHLYARDFWRDNGGIDQFDADKIRDGLNLKPGGQLTEEQFVRAVKNGHWTALEAPEFVEWLVGLGHDAVVTKEGGAINYGIMNSNAIKSAIGNRGTYDTSKEDLSKAKGGSVMGVNVASDRKAGRSYADLIVDGQKTLESRNGDSLRPYVGKRVAIVRTGEGKAKAIGEVTIGEPMVVNSKQFRELEHRHMVPKNSTFDINTPTKHLYPLHNPERYDQEREVGHGIVSRKVMTVAKGGKVSQDAMMMKVMDAKMAKKKFVNDNHREWFGDSKVVDAKGNPLKVYHGTDRDFSEFKKGRSLKRYPNFNNSQKHLGHFFSDDPEYVSNYAGRGFDKEDAVIMPVHLSMKNPKIEPLSKIDEIEDQWSMGKAVAYRKQLEDQGYDGIIFEGTAKIGPTREYVVFRPEQIKSAIGNRGTYDPNDPDITKAGGGPVNLAKGGQPPERTVKAYKLFRVHPKHPGKLFPLFVNANQPVEMNKWVDAEVGPQTDTGKVKSKLGPLAYRPGWHAGDVPVATHIGERSDPSLSAPDIRPANHAWAEVEMPDDVDWQAEANKRGTNAQGKLVPVKAHITDQIPKGGHYRYKTNPNMTGNWLIGGSMKVKRVLTDKEVERINKAAGVADLPRAEPFDKKKFGFKRGGKVTHAHHLEIEERPL